MPISISPPSGMRMNMVTAPNLSGTRKSRSRSTWTPASARPPSFPLSRHPAAPSMMTMTTEARISTGYQARPLQNRLHHALKRFNVIVAHRRFGKTVFALNHIIHKAIRNERIMPRYAYIAPTFGQAKRIAWDYLKMYTAAFPAVTSNDQDLRG